MIHCQSIGVYHASGPLTFFRVSVTLSYKYDTDLTQRHDVNLSLYKEKQLGISFAICILQP